MSKTIEILVLPDGQTKVETKGFAGKECLAASRFVVEALGRKTSERLTGEFYQAARTESLRQHEG